MQNNKKTRSPKIKLEKIITVFTGTMVAVLLSAGYALSFFDYVITPAIKNEINIDEDKIGADIFSDDRNKEEAPIHNIDESPITSKRNTVNKEEIPSISIVSVNVEHKDDPDYVTYNINLKDAYYIKVIDGKEVEIPFTDISGGTISIPKVKNNEAINKENQD